MSQHCLTRGLEVQPSWTLANVAVALHIATCSNPYYGFDLCLPAQPSFNIQAHLHAVQLAIWLEARADACDFSALPND